MTVSLTVHPAFHLHRLLKALFVSGSLEFEKESHSPDAPAHSGATNAVSAGALAHTAAAVAKLRVLSKAVESQSSQGVATQC